MKIADCRLDSGKNNFTRKIKCVIVNTGKFLKIRKLEGKIYMNRISDIIEEYVKEKKITYRQLARELGTSHTQVFLMLENESLPKVETMKKMSKIMHIPIDEIKKAAFKEVDGEYKAYLTEEELRNRGITVKKKKKSS